MQKTKIIKVNPEKPDLKSIKEAAKIIKKGGLVAFPTETVYGLGAAYNNPDAVTKIYNVKKRSKNKPLTIHISKMKTLESFDCEITHLAKTLMNKFWPGPLTIILNTKDNKKTIAFRMPEGEIAKCFIEACGIPIVAPSANISGNKSPVSAEGVLKDLDGKIEAVIDGGTTDLGAESTIIDVTSFPYRVIREGVISKARIQDAWHEV
ncbi:MAG: threonylcarbamoyl-AMP synthase [Candidatus Omnitrophica bacterium]|nr:threonylcarbamoyl-AMP synthase [Candidatus Omnitrophota bacterium]